MSRSQPQRAPKNNSKLKRPQKKRQAPSLLRAAATETIKGSRVRRVKTPAQTGNGRTHKTKRNSEAVAIATMRSPAKQTKATKPRAVTRVQAAATEPALPRDLFIGTATAAKSPDTAEVPMPNGRIPQASRDIRYFEPKPPTQETGASPARDAPLRSSAIPSVFAMQRMFAATLLLTPWGMTPWGQATARFLAN